MICRLLETFRPRVTTNYTLPYNILNALCGCFALSLPTRISIHNLIFENENIMLMNKIKAYLLLLTIALSAFAAACSSDDNDPVTPEITISEKTFWRME